MNDTLSINYIPTKSHEEPLDNSYWQSNIFTHEHSLMHQLKKSFYFLDEIEITQILHAYRN
jgi:hypothetical protein